MQVNNKNNTGTDTIDHQSASDAVAQRMSRLKDDIKDYTAVKDKILTGFDFAERSAKIKAKILKKLDATEEDWQDYRWQLKNRLTTADEVAEIIDLTEKEYKDIDEVASQYRFAISPYYLSLIDPEDENCPIRLQSIPTITEMDPIGELDPMDEAGSTPVPGITRRYPDRLIIKVTNQCGMYCRFCQRRRLIGEQDHHTDLEMIYNAIDYIAREKEVRDVLITGGDALMLSDDLLDDILARLRKIDHVEIIRIGSRTPVTLPQRITPNLVNILKKYHPLYVNTHFNSPSEISPEAEKACSLLADAGIPIGNQMVLLGGINNNKYVVRKLNQQLLKIRVKPYYIFHAKQVRGTSRFWVRIEEGLEIMESLRGATSGMAIPTYIVNGTGGLGKTPMLPNYLLYIGKNKAVFRNWEGDTFEIENDFAPNEFKSKFN